MLWVKFDNDMEIVGSEICVVNPSTALAASVNSAMLSTSAQVVRQLEAAFQKYSEAMATANGRWSEWGDRAESTAEKLQELGEMLEAAIRKQIAELGKVRVN